MGAVLFPHEPLWKEKPQRPAWHSGQTQGQQTEVGITVEIGNVKTVMTALRTSFLHILSFSPTCRLS